MFRRVYTWEGSQWGEEGASPSHILGAYQRGIIMSFFGAGRNISGLAMIYGGGPVSLHSFWEPDTHFTSRAHTCFGGYPVYLLTADEGLALLNTCWFLLRLMGLLIPLESFQ